MHQFIQRRQEAQILNLIKVYPVVVITGPRQVGKTSLVKHLVGQLDKSAVYLDLEYPDDLNKFANPALFLETLLESTVIIDEVQRLPQLFPILRSLIDRKRTPGRFILLGSASPELIRDSSESLAGRVAYIELPPFSLEEIKGHIDFIGHWLRGGFPESLLANNDAMSFQWRQYFIQAYLERDLPMLGLNAEPQMIRNLWTMIAHMHGETLNMQSLSRSLGISGPTVRRYIDFLESAFLIRRLQPFFINTKKRLVKAPKIYVRDTGILHALLNIGDASVLFGHPKSGTSWEAYILQELYTRLPPRTELFYYRTQDGTEADIVVAEAGIPKSLIEIKLSSTAILKKGFYIAKTDLRTTSHFVICPIKTGYPIDADIRVIGYEEFDTVFE